MGYLHFLHVMLTILGTVPHALSLHCYTCQYTQTDGAPGEQCVYDPDAYTVDAAFAECPPEVTQCYSHSRTQAGDSLIYVGRGCRAGVETEGCEDQSGEMWCNYFCDSHLCNTEAFNTTQSTEQPEQPSTSPDSLTEVQPTTTVTPEKYYIECYSCGNTPECINNVTTQTFIHCNITAPDGRTRGCYVHRRTNNDDGSIYDFQRSCEVLEALIPSYGCVPDSTQTTCVTSCTTDLCNADDGIPTPAPPPPPQPPNHAPSTQATVITSLLISALSYTLK